MDTFAEYISSAVGYLKGAQRTSDRVFARYAIISAQSARARAASQAQRSEAADVIRQAEDVLAVRQTQKISDSHVNHEERNRHDQR